MSGQGRRERLNTVVNRPLRFVLQGEETPFLETEGLITDYLADTVVTVEGKEYYVIMLYFDGTSAEVTVREVKDGGPGNNPE